MSGGVAPSVAIYFNKTCFGLAVDANVLSQLLRKCGVASIRQLDMNEPPVAVDIAFHLETPVAQVMGYAHCNILMINAEQWISTVYDPYLDSFDFVFFRAMDDLQRFKKELSVQGRRCDHFRYIPWSLGMVSEASASASASASAVVGTSIDEKIGFISFIGKNQYKYEWLRDFLTAGGWKETFPSLRIYTSKEEYAKGLTDAVGSATSNIQIECRDLDNATIDRLQWLYQGHLLCSRGEGFGYAAAEAEAHGAKLLLSELPVFKEYYQDQTNGTVGWIGSEPITASSDSLPKARSDLRYTLMGPVSRPGDSTEKAINTLVNSTPLSGDERRTMGRSAATKRWLASLDGFQTALWQDTLEVVKKRRPNSGNWHCPPVLMPSDCPPITIITPTRNRRNLIEIAFHNLLSTDYPLKKIEWIVIEDSTTEKSASDRIINFQINCQDLKLKYIPLQSGDGGGGSEGGKVWTIGEKRNIGVEHASNEIILFMDDDDHYPPTSFRRRVAWLCRGMESGKTICGCTTLALYDLRHGISAVNVPPWDLPQCQRISEATLAFSKQAWLDRKFQDISVSEGEEWIKGREREFLEIPPQQIIVAFSHGENSTSRRVPLLEKPNGCFWGFPKEYLQFVHRLAGVELEEQKAEIQGQAQTRTRSQAPSRAHARNHQKK